MREKAFYVTPSVEIVAMADKVELLMGSKLIPTATIRSEWVSDADCSADKISTDQSLKDGTLYVDETHATKDGTDGYFGY